MTLFICNDTHYRQAQANWFVTRSSRARSLAVAVPVEQMPLRFSVFNNHHFITRQVSAVIFSLLSTSLPLSSLPVLSSSASSSFPSLSVLLVVQKCSLMRWLVQLIDRCGCFGRNLNSDRCAYGIGIRAVQSGWLKKCASSGEKKEKGRGKIWTRFPMTTNTELASSGRSCMSREYRYIYLSICLYLFTM